MNELIRALADGATLTQNEWQTLIESKDRVDRNELYRLAESTRKKDYGDNVYIRGLIEFTSHCKNDCLYCGLRRSNLKAQRYRLTKPEIMECVEVGYDLGFRTFVLQGGEDPYYKPEMVAEIVSAIKDSHPDSAVTLSFGEHPRQAYRLWRKAGADRYLLRHETASARHYGRLHPREMTLSTRMDCLESLKSLGYQVGVGFMVGSPFQTTQSLAMDMAFIQSFRPHMVGIGPFIPHKDTPFGDRPAGTLEDTLFFLSLIRLALPKVLLPATTALGTISPTGREMGIKAGANVVMPNLSPLNVRSKYLLYDNKISTGEEAAESVNLLRKKMDSIGYRIVTSRGDSLM